MFSLQSMEAPPPVPACPPPVPSSPPPDDSLPLEAMLPSSSPPLSIPQPSSSPPLSIPQPSSSPPLSIPQPSSSPPLSSSSPPDSTPPQSPSPAGSPAPLSFTFPQDENPTHVKPTSHSSLSSQHLPSEVCEDTRVFVAVMDYDPTSLCTTGRPDLEIFLQTGMCVNYTHTPLVLIYVLHILVFVKMLYSLLW